jgi:hypothetical protein
MASREESPTMRTRNLLSGLLTLALAACSAGEAVTPTPEPAITPSPPPVTTVTPTLESASTPSALDVKVAFDGETCTYFGPTVIVDGTVVRFEYAPGRGMAEGSSLLVYGVQPGITYGDLLASLATNSEFNDVTVGIPDWVYQPTAAWLEGAGTMLYTIESVKHGSDDVDYAVGGYQVMCNTPAGYPAVQLSVAGP